MDEEIPGSIPGLFLIMSMADIVILHKQLGGKANKLNK